jgi:hypothetical protein
MLTIEDALALERKHLLRYVAREVEAEAEADACGPFESISVR